MLYSDPIFPETISDSSVINSWSMAMMSRAPALDIRLPINMEMNRDAVIANLRAETSVGL